MFSSILIRVLVLLPSVITTCTDCCTCTETIIPEVLPEVTNKILVSSSYLTVVTGSVVQCGIRCLRQKKCKSFNYESTSGSCTLHNSTNYALPDQMYVRPTASWIHYFVGQWDQTLLGECSNHDCEEEEVCEILGGSSGTKYRCRSSYSDDQICLQSSCAECQPSRVYNGRTYTAIGCYPSGYPNVVPHFLGNFGGGAIIWDDLSSFEAIIQRCALAAYGYHYFGIESYGHCYGGNHYEVALPGQVGVAQCDTKCLYQGIMGVGSTDIMFVYRWI